MSREEAKIPLYLFVLSGLLFVFSEAFGIEMIGFLVKPIIIPSIFFFYILTRSTKVNFLFSLIFLLFFVGDMIIMLYSQEFMSLILLPFMISYIILLKFIFEDLNFSKKKMCNYTILYT
jgi:hypothetical protein